LRRSRLALLLPVLLLAAACSAHVASRRAVSAQQRELQIERGLACPQCTDLALDVCDQDICNDMRAILQQKVANGESDAAIRAFFVQRYGPRVLLVPPKTSSTWLAWLMPFAGLAAGAAVTAAFLRAAARRRKSNAMEQSLPRISSELRARVELELGDVE
jgi:cytochrome c-type biogenesis protein CcmH